MSLLMKYDIHYWKNKNMVLIFLGGALFWDENNAVKAVNKKSRVFQCQLCQYSTYNSGHLKRHTLTHTGERRFACPVCNQRFTLKENLKKHIGLKHSYSFVT